MSLLRERTQRSVAEIVDNFPGVLGVHAIDPANPDLTISVNDEEVFPIASVIKIPILLEFFSKVEKGELNPNLKVPLKEEIKVGGSGVLQYLTPEEAVLTLEDYATLMINLSDNSATNLLIDTVGMKDVNTALDGLGFTVTRLKRKMQDLTVDPEVEENLSTPREMSRLLELIYNGEGLSPFVCEKTLDVLKYYKSGVIRDVVPVGLEVANKSGWMGGVQCDMGIVYQPGKPYIVSLMAKHVPKWDHNNLNVRETMRDIVRVIHGYFDEVSSATRFGRRV